MKLTADERDILTRLTKEQLLFLSSIAGDTNFSVFSQIINFLIDQEKNIFFKNTAYDKEKLAADLAFSRGGVAKITMFYHVIVGSKAELDRRNEERKKK